MELQTSDSEYSTSDKELQEAFEKGLVKPGLNAVEPKKKQPSNYVTLMKKKLDKIKLNLPWIERLDMINSPAPLAPQLALRVQNQELRRSNQLQGNKTLPQYEPHEDPVLNDLHRETMFHRQAQSAIVEGISRLKAHGAPTTRPSDYFAEMAKTDEHMGKVRKHLTIQQENALRSEKVKQLRAQRKVAKQMQIEATLKKHAEKRKILEEVKKYRKGVRKDLDFLEDNKKGKQHNRTINRKALAKEKAKAKKYGFGGKKRGSKWNTKSSSADVSEYKRPSKLGKGRVGKGGKGGKGKQRLGRSRRIQMKNKKSK